MLTYDYTISSTDINNYSNIFTNLAHPQTEYCKMTVTSLTTMANIVVLNKSDYITIQTQNTNHVVHMDNDFTEVSTSSLCEYLNTVVPQIIDNIAFYYDSCNRIQIVSTNSFSITDCSYNLKLLLGIVNESLPIASEQRNDTKYYISLKSVGDFLLTPVLYLASNLGSNSFKVAGKNVASSMRILMRINNSYFAKQPITATNGDYTTTVRSSDLSDVRFTLIDANYHEIKLLNPMYITVQIEVIPDKLDLEHDMSNGPVNPLTIAPMTEYAYMRDLTERGIDVDMDDVGKLIFINPPQPQEQSEQTASKQD